MAEYRCPNCGDVHSESHAFCPGCGSKMDEPAASPSRAAPKKRYSPLAEWGILVVIVFATIVAYGLISKSHDGAEAAPTEIETTADSFQTAVNLGNSFMDRGLYDHAIKQYERALEFDSLQPDIYVDLGACYHGVGEIDEAVIQFQRALDQDPNHPVALFNMGVAELSRADTAAARTWWEKYLAVSGDTPQADMVRQRLEEL